MLDVRLEKKIKKNIYAKPQKIQAIFPSGFSNVANHELQKILSTLWFPQKFHSEILPSKNVILISNIHMFAAVELLLRSQTLSDIRLILLEGKVVGKGAFAKKIQSIDWDFFLNHSMSLKIKVTSVASKAFHETGLKEIVTTILQDRVKEIVSGENTHETTALYVDFFKDRLTVSISLAGAHLYKRGYRSILSASAPLREDIAASCIQSVFSWQNFNVEKVIVPFAGTGTFIFEFIQYHYQLANFFREFAIEKMPLFKKENFNFLLKKAKENIKNNEEISFAAIDNSAEAIKAFEKNLDLFKENLAKKSVQFHLEIEQSMEDFFEMKMEKNIGNIFLPLNPPYGIRLNQKMNVAAFYKKIAIKINEMTEAVKKEKKQVMGFIFCPTEESWSSFCKQIKNMKLNTYHFNQGGLDIRVCEFFSY